jgi:hypothetical protein
VLCLSDFAHIYEIMSDDREMRRIENRIRVVEYLLKLEQTKLNNPFGKIHVVFKKPIKFTIDINTNMPTTEVPVTVVSENNITVDPPKKRRWSKPEKACLDYLCIPIENRQINISGYCVDGLNDKIIYEFLGDYWHGNPKCYNLNDRTHFGVSFKDLNDRTFVRLNDLKSKGYIVKYIWELDWYHFKKGIDKTLNINTLI